MIGTQSTGSNHDQPLSQPGGFQEQGWQEKINIAKEARIQGQELRGAGKNAQGVVFDHRKVP